MESMTCKELADGLGKLPMHVGKVKKEVCSEKDLDGKKILPSGIKKILAYYEKEMDILETGKPDVVFVEALRQQLPNPRWMLAFDRERKQKVKVSVPKNRKAFLSKPKTRFLVERGCENGNFFYKWSPNLKQ